MAATEAIIEFELTDLDENNQGFIDLAQCCSAIGRKLERQQQQMVIQSVSLQTSQTGIIEIFRLPSNWSTVNAINKAYYHWKQQQDDVAEEAGIESTRAKYRDFKVFYNAAHQAAGTDENLTPKKCYGWGVRPAPAGTFYEWDASQIAVPNVGTPGTTVEYNLHVLGDDVAAAPLYSFGVIKAYGDSRSRPQAVDPNFVDVAGGGLYGLMDDVGDNLTEVVTNYQDHNHVPPYVIGDVADATSYNDEYYWGGANVGGEIRECALISNTAVSTIRTTAGGFVANCGLLRVYSQGITDGILTIRMAVDDKGYVTRPMLEGN